MQTQDAPSEFLFKLWPWLEANQKWLMAAGAGVIVLIGAGYFVSAQHAARETAAGEAMTQLLMSPSSNVGQSGDALVQLAATYSGTEAGKRAMLQGAASLFAAGRYADAQAQFQNYLNSSVSAPQEATAELGLGSCLEAQNKLTEAAAAYQRVMSSDKATVATPVAHCALGRIAEEQGHLTEAANQYQAAYETGREGGSPAQAAGFYLQAVKAKIAAGQSSAPTAAPMTAPVTTPAATPNFIIPSK